MDKVNINKISDDDHIGFIWGGSRWSVMYMKNADSEKKYSCSEDYVKRPTGSMVPNQSKREYLERLYKNKGSVSYTVYRFESPELLKHWLKTGKFSADEN